MELKKQSELFCELSEANSDNIIAKLGSFYDIAATVVAKAKGITVLSAGDNEAVEAAKEMRKEVRSMRLNCEAEKKGLKAETNRFNKVVDTINKYIVDNCKEAESHLEAQEKFAENELAKEREAIAAEFTEYIAQNLKFGRMKQGEFDLLISNAKLAKAGAEAIENERVAKEKAALEKQEINLARAKQLAPYMPVVEGYATLDLGEMSEPQFLDLLAASSVKFEAETKRKNEEAANEQVRLRKEAEADKAKAEKEANELRAIEAERAEEAEANRKKEIEAQRERNRLAGIEAKKISRERHEARLIKEKADADAKALKAAQDKEAARLAEIEADKQARLGATDAKKLELLLADLSAIEIPNSFDSDKGAKAKSWIEVKLSELKTGIKLMKNKLT